MEDILHYKFPNKPSIVYMGTPDFAVPALKSLIREGYDILTVVTQPDRPRGRGKKLSFSPVKEAALENNLTILQPEDIREQRFIDEIKALNPDLFVVAAFGQILDEALLSIPTCCPLNIHASILPKYRGAAPIQSAILNNDKVTGITIMKMSKGLDKGPAFMKEEVLINENETTGQLFDRLAELSGDVLVNFLKSSAGKEIEAVPQEDEFASYASKVTKHTAEIDWDEDTVKIASLIKAMDPMPGATTTMNGKKIKLFSPVVCEGKEASGRPGMVVTGDASKFLVETGNGILEIKEIQLPGKKRISTADFLRGNKIEKNTILGI